MAALDRTITHEIGERLARVLTNNDHHHQLNRMEHLLHTLHEKVNQMKQEIADLRAKVDTDNAAMKAALSNIAADEQRQAAQIAELLARIEAGSALDQADLDNLSAISTAIGETATALQAVADSIPEPLPPVEG